jgi:hypothetical protein
MAGSDDFAPSSASACLVTTMHLPRLRDAAHEKYHDLLYASGTPIE